MKKILLFMSFVALAAVSRGQWSITTLGPTTDTITFDATFSGVNNGIFAGAGLTATPGAGLLDSDAWKFTGFSDGTTSFGGTYTSGDHARGGSDGGEFSGGIYSFEVAAGDSALGVQPTGSDFTPGSIMLRVINNSGFDADSLFVSYNLVVNNDADRGNTFDLGYAVNDSVNFTFPTELEYTSVAASQGGVVWVDTAIAAGIIVNVNDGDTLYLVWDSDDLLGGGSRDEFAIDNIVVSLDSGSSSVTPPAPSIPEYPIATINTEDGAGVADSLGVTCFTRGVVVGIDFDGNDGYNFYIMDTLGGQVNGINVFNFDDVDGYVVAEGDSVLLRGEVGQFNGLTQFEPDSISLLNQGNTLPDTATISTLDESTEGTLVRFENALITDINFGANYTLVSGMDTIVMRVDSDTDINDSLDLGIGDSLCWVVGIGSQFDANGSPLTDGYQMFPRYSTDIDTSCGTPAPAPIVPFYPIPDINNDDANGEPDSLSVYCFTTGVVLGVDLDGNTGLSFTLWDDEGINIFNFSDISNYTVTEGDSLMVRGEIDFFNGLTELFVDSIEVLNTGNPVPSPMMVGTPSQSTESEPITIETVRVIDTAQWTNPGGFSSNVDLLNCNGDTIVMRIDTDTDVDENWPSAPLGYFNITGIGGQYDQNAPYLQGYQIFPMYGTDIVEITTPDAPSLVINELMADNQSAIDDNGAFDDWIELYNTGSSTVSLAGLYLSNDANNSMLYQVPTGSSAEVAAGDYQLIWADNESSQGDLHTNFTLDATGGYVSLAMPYGCSSMTVDSIEYIALGPDESYGRETDGGTPWVIFSTSTPEATNEDGSTGVEDLGNDAFKVWPNPSNGAWVQFNQKVDATLFNLTGQVVRTVRNANSVNVEDLPQGMYMMETSLGDTIKLIVE